MNYRTTPGFSFACTGCGGCCTGQNIGPLSVAEVERVKASDHPALVALRERVGGGLFRRARQEDGSGARLVCRQQATGCVFLGDDALCALHAALGAEAKFVPCRMFPYRLIETPEGIDVTLLPECRQWLQARRAGAARPRADYEAEWDDLLALEQKRVAFPDVLPIHEGVAVRYGAYRAWEDGALASLAGWRSGTLPGALAPVAGSLVRTFGLEPPEPSCTPEGLHDLLMVLREFLVQAMDEFPPPSGPEAGTHAWTQALIDSLDLAPLYAGRVTLDRLSPDARELLAEGALNFLYGKAWIVFGTVALGVAVTNLLALLTLNLAYHKARLGRRLDVDPLDVQDATSEVYVLARGSYFRVLVEHAAEAILAQFLYEADGLEPRWRTLGELWSGPEMYVL